MYLSMTSLVVLLIGVGILFYTTLYYRAQAIGAIKLVFEAAETFQGHMERINELKGMLLEKSLEICALKRYSDPRAEVKSIDTSLM